MQPPGQHTIAVCTLEDLFTACFVIIDDLYRLFAPPEVKQRPGPPPNLSDAEVITIAVVGELFGMEVEGRWYSLVQQHYRGLFPGLNERSRFNRRRRDLWQVTNHLRSHLMETLVSPHHPWRILDSFPLVVANWGRRSRVRVAREEGGFGRAHAKQQPFFGYRVHLLITLEGIVANFVLAPANLHDSTVAPEAFEGMEELIALGDKAYYSVPLETELAQHRIRLVALRRRDARRPLPQELAKVVRSARQLVETVGSQLAQVFHIEHNLAKSTWGIKARLSNKLLGHTVGCYLNHLMGRPLLHMAGLVYH